jgi:hypothetical protein
LDLDWTRGKRLLNRQLGFWFNIANREEIDTIAIYPRDIGGKVNS